METYIRLCKLLKERGVESESELLKFENDITTYQIVDILRKDTLVKLWGTEFTTTLLISRNNTSENGNGLIREWRYQRLKLLELWDSEQNNPLEQCPKVADYLLENIGGVR